MAIGSCIFLPDAGDPGVHPVLSRYQDCHRPSTAAEEVQPVVMRTYREIYPRSRYMRPAFSKT